MTSSYGDRQCTVCGHQHSMLSFDGRTSPEDKFHANLAEQLMLFQEVSYMQQLVQLGEIALHRLESTLNPIMSNGRQRYCTVVLVNGCSELLDQGKVE